MIVITLTYITKNIAKMKFFLDTANIEEIAEFANTGLLDGVTTNPSIIANYGKPFEEVIAAICKVVDGPVSAEVTATDYETMLKQGRHLAQIASNVVIKVPLTPDGLKACYTLRQEEIDVNVTLCFSAGQALLAAKAGATFISPFIGRIDDIGYQGMNLIQEIAQIYSNYPDFNTQILAASIRSPLHVTEAAQMGADVATMPTKVLKQLFKHPLTDLGLEAFLKDWKNTDQKILA